MTSQVENKQITVLLGFVSVHLSPPAPSFYVIKRGSWTMRMPRGAFKGCPPPHHQLPLLQAPSLTFKDLSRGDCFHCRRTSCYVCVHKYLFFPSVTITTSYTGLMPKCFKIYYRIICWDELNSPSWGISQTLGCVSLCEWFGIICSQRYANTKVSLWLRDQGLMQY